MQRSSRFNLSQHFSSTTSLRRAGMIWLVALGVLLLAPLEGEAQSSEQLGSAIDGFQAVRAPGSDATEVPQEKGSPRSVKNGDNEWKDTGVLWRGFRHVWSYNHRVNRLGSWVKPKSCDGTSCEYSVGHSGASGSGPDDFSFREAYTELSAKGVGFHSDSHTFNVTGVEKKPGPQSQLITGSEREFVQYTDLQVNSPSEGTYAVLLNGFDLVRKDGNAEKFVRFELEVTEVKNDPEPYTLTNGDVSFNIRYKLLFNCDSGECKFTDMNGPAQKVDYDLTVHYVLLEGSNRSLNVVRGSDLTNDNIQWSHCKNNKVKPTPWADESNFNDKWDNPLAFHPGNHMFCEDSENRQIHHENYWKTSTIHGESGSSGSRYSVGAVGVKRMTLQAEGGTHYVQYDNVVGGNYSKETGTYDVRALPFWKEWSTRPGIHKKAALSFGHAGSAEVGVQPVLIQVRDGCKRGLVAAGGKHWPGKGKKPTGSDAVVSTNYQFDFSEQWIGYGGRGSLCQHTQEGEVEYTEYTSDNQAFSIAHTSGGKTAWKEFQPYKKTRKHLIAERTAEEPTQLRGRLSDRYYSPSNLAATGGSEISLSVRQGQESGQVSYYSEENTILDAGGTNSGFIARNAGLFDPTDSGGDWPVFTVRPTKEVRVETFLQNLETGETQWVGSSDGGGTSLTERVSDTGPYALETVFDGPKTGPTVAATRLWVKKYPTIRKRLEWTIRGDFETKTDASTATRSFSYEWLSGQHQRVRPGWRLAVNTETGGGIQGGLSSPMDVHAFRRYFGAEAEGTGPVLDTRVETDDRELEKSFWHPTSSPPNHGTYTLSIFACYNVIAAHQTSDSFDCRAGSSGIGAEKSVEHTIKVGDAYGPEQPTVSVKGLERQQGSGIGHVDYHSSEETVTFRWTRPQDQGAPNLNIAPVGLEKYKIEASADGGQSYTLAEENFGTARSNTQVSGDQRMMDVSFSRDGYHEFRLWAIDEVGNASPVEKVKLCVQEPDCETAAEKTAEAAAAQEATRKMEAYQMMEDFLNEYGVDGPDIGEEDDPGDVIPGVDVGPGGGVPCKVCSAANLGWMPRGERMNIYVQEQRGEMVPYHALVQDGQIVRLGKSGFSNPTREVTMSPGEMRTIADSERPLQSMHAAVLDKSEQSYSENSEETTGEQPSSDQVADPQTSSPVTLALLPRAGAFLSGVSSLEGVSGAVGSTLGGKTSVLTWGGSLAFGSRNGTTNFRLTGMRTTGSLFSTTEGVESAEGEVPEKLLLLTGDFVLRPIPRLLVQPYAIGGAGGRRLSTRGTGGAEGGSSWEAAAQVGIGLDLRLGNFTLGVEIVDYLSGFSGSTEGLQHDAFGFLTLGVPIN